MTQPDREQILRGVERYCHAVHTQRAEDFQPLWAEGTQNGLLSPAGCFSGTEEIYRDFLVGRIGAAYARIDLIAESVEVRSVTEDAAVALFRYATDCIRRDTGEPYGIAGLETQLWVRQGGEWRLCHVHYSKQRGTAAAHLSAAGAGECYRATSIIPNSEGRRRNPFRASRGRWRAGTLDGRCRRPG